MKTPSGWLIARVVIALAAGLVEPYAEIAWKCRAGFETSEACVWGKAYLPLGRVAGLVIIAPIAFATLSLAAWLARSCRGCRQPRPRTGSTGATELTGRGGPAIRLGCRCLRLL